MRIFEGKGGTVSCHHHKPEAEAGSSQDEGRAPRAASLSQALAWCPLEPFCPRQHKSCGLSSCPRPGGEASSPSPYSGSWAGRAGATSPAQTHQAVTGQVCVCVCMRVCDHLLRHYLCVKKSFVSDSTAGQSWENYRNRFIQTPLFIEVVFRRKIPRGWKLRPHDYEVNSLSIPS